MDGTENQPETYLQKKQADKEDQQDLAEVTLKIVQNFKYRFGSHKLLQSL